jgi:hypothetical protein
LTNFTVKVPYYGNQTFSSDHQIIIKNLPMLKTLSFSNYFNQPIHIEELQLLESLNFGNSFNQNLTLKELPSLKSLSVGNSFNQELMLNDLSTLTSISIGEQFNKHLNYYLPNLTLLSLDKSYNHPIDIHEYLPSIKTLRLITNSTYKSTGPLVEDYHFD